MCSNSSPSSRFSIEGASRLVQLVSGEPLKGIRRADVAHQPGITDSVTSGANNPRPSDCNTRSDAPTQATSGRYPGCITPMYRRYGPGIITAITVALHHAFVIRRIYVGDLNWRRLILVRLRHTKYSTRLVRAHKESRKPESPYEITSRPPPLAGSLCNSSMAATTISYIYNRLLQCVRLYNKIPNLPMVPSVIVD